MTAVASAQVLDASHRLAAGRALGLDEGIRACCATLAVLALAAPGSARAFGGPAHDVRDPVDTSASGRAIVPDNDGRGALTPTGPELAVNAPGTWRW